ncbi:MAG: PAS domain-containing protein, partial [Alphaproteobacteria bacterium]|nr:PAS domain-containing protein [Alphaproteobacteria bacterium]
MPNVARTYSLIGFFCALPAGAYAAEGVLIPGVTGLAVGWVMALLLYAAKRRQRKNYEGRLKETSRMLASQGAWLHSAPMEYLRLTPQGVVQSCSPGLRRTLGIVEHDMTLELLGNYIHPEDFDLLRQTISMCSAQGGEGISILRKRKASDQVLECVVVGADKTGAEEDIVVWLKDISEQRRTITSLQSNLSEATHERGLLNMLLSMSPFPVWRRNKDLKIIYGNPSFMALVGASDQGAIPDIDRQASQLAAQAVTAGKALSEKRHIIVGGERKFYTLTEVPLSGDQGTVGYAQDLSAVEVAETELQRHIHAHSDLLESSASAMAIFGQDQRLKFYNNAFLRLWKLEESWLESEPNYGEFLEALREKRRLPEQANFPVFKREQLGMFRDLIDPREDFYYMPDGMALRVLVIPHALGGLLFSYEDVTDKLALERSYNTLIAVQRATLDKL